MFKLSPKTKSILFVGGLLLLLTIIYDNHFASRITINYASATVSNIRDTVVVLGSLYITTGILHYAINHNFRNLKKKLYFKKFVSALIIISGVFCALLIWVETSQTFTTYFGFVTIAIAVSFQDFFRNIVGSIIINTTRNIEIGDQVEINGQIGKVVDIGFLYTTLLETPSWNNVDQVNNREIKLPNQIFNNQISKSFDIKDNFMWDEIELKVPSGTNLSKLEKSIYTLTKKEIKSLEQPSKAFLKNLHKNLVGKPKGDDWTVKIYFDIRDEFTYLTLRYFVHSNELRLTRSNLVKKIIPLLEK